MNEDKRNKCGNTCSDCPEKNKKTTRGSELIGLILIIVLLAASIGFGTWRQNQDMVNQIATLVPGASNYEKMSTDPLVYKALTADNETIGYCGFGEGIGYAGNIKMAVSVDQDSNILGVKVLSQKETPSFFNKLIDAGYYEQYNGKNIKENPLELNKDIAAVSGATISSRGSVNAVIDAIQGVVAQEPSLAGEIDWQQRAEAALQDTGVDKLPIIILLVFIAIVIFSSWKKLNKVRWATMIGGIIFLGIWQERMISLAVIGNFLMNPLLYFKINTFSAVLLIAVILICLLMGKNLYCYWMCPFGAAQEIIFKASGSKNPRIDKRIRDICGKITRIIALAALLGGIILSNPGLTSFEPFATLFGFNGGAIQWTLLAVVLVGAFFVERFWCRYFCPVGIINKYLVKWGSKIRKSFGSKKQEKQQENIDA